MRLCTERIRNDNIRFFIRHNVKGIFEQDTYNTSNSELAELGGYMTAKFLWNADYDEETAMREFLEGYYGKAAGPIRKYIDMLHDRPEQQNIHVNIWAGPESPHLTGAMLIVADKLWQQAEQQVAGEPDVLRRVKLSRMSVDCAIFERARLQAAKKLPANAELQTVAARRFDPFFETFNASSLSRIREWDRVDKDDYRKKLAKALEGESKKGDRNGVDELLSLLRGLRCIATVSIPGAHAPGY